jgi:hypothetical protein
VIIVSKTVTVQSGTTTAATGNGVFEGDMVEPEDGVENGVEDGTLYKPSS